MIKAIDIIKKFNLKVLNYETSYLNRKIKSPSMHRAGLVLSGKMKNNFFNKVICWGTNENNWLSTLKEEEIKKSILNVLNSKTPILILSLGINKRILNIILLIASRFKIPVIQINQHLSTINSTIGDYIIQKFSPSKIIHGSLCIVNGVGVLVIGESGIGKSEAILELIQKGHIFVSDDTVVIKRIGKNFFGEPAKLTKNFLECRGLGIIDIKYIYGKKSTIEKAKIDLVISLIRYDKNYNFDRLGNQKLKFNLLNGFIDKIEIPVRKGRTISSLIETAVNLQVSRNNYIDPLKIIVERRKKYEKLE